MMSEHYVECRTLTTINDNFPQFSTRPSQEPHHPQLPSTTTVTTVSQSTGIPRNNLIISPLDLSLRAGVNIVPITPPSTPSPPRKRSRFMSDEHYLWRPHVMGTPTINETTVTNKTITSNTTDIPNTVAEHPNFFHPITYTRHEELTSAYALNEEVYNHTTTSVSTPAKETVTATETQSFIIDNNRETISNFGQIPKSQRSENTLTTNKYQCSPHSHKQHPSQIQYQQPQQQQQQQQQHHSNMSTNCVDDETIVLTEDEDDEDVEANVDDEEDEDDNNEYDEENETLVSSQEFNEYDETYEPSLTYNSPKSPHNPRSEHSHNSQTQDHSNTEQDEEEVYVDVLGNDDEDDINPLSGRAITMLRLQNQTDLEQELEKSGKVLTRNKLVYENEELHNRAIDGLAKLFRKDFHKRQDETSLSGVNLDKGKTYIDLTNCHKSKHPSFILPPLTQKRYEHPDKGQQFMITSHLSSTSRPYKTHKTERKRMKLRKHMSLDEETISPVSGTIIRKLRDDEELVVRKGDIDPAFNVVEVTEEAKAILASIDNKIGAYLCQLCRTLYDDAFKLAQHRCPRIVHIEYKCSECEKIFNCPANLASHRRWHKPKSELLANSQSKKRTQLDRNLQSKTNVTEKIAAVDDGVDGIFPCNQCGKTFRRHVYLKKHQTSHQMLENFKSLDIFKNSSTTSTSFQPSSGHMTNLSLSTPPRIQPNTLYPALQHPRPYPSRFTGFPFPGPFDHRRFYTLGEFYLSQQLERSSAFQYVQANHLHNLSNVAGNFINRPVVPSPIIPLPVK